MSWYYVDQGRQAGPVEDARLDELRREGKVLDDTLVWQEGLPNWIPFREAQPAAPAPPFPPPPVVAPPVAAPTVAPPVQVNPMVMGATGHLLEAMCAECGKIFSTDNMIRVGATYVCATCKPVFIQKLSEGARINPSALQYAGFWIRVVAKIVDRIILLLIVAVPFILIVGFVSSTFRSSPSSSAPSSSALDRPLDLRLPLPAAERGEGWPVLRSSTAEGGGEGNSGGRSCVSSPPNLCCTLKSLLSPALSSLSREERETEYNIWWWAMDGPEWVFPVIAVLFYLVPICTEVAYNVFFLGRYGATPGKMVCQLLVVDASGSRIGYSRALGRAFAEILSWMTMGVGYVIAAFDPQKRSLNDHLCNTRVVHK